MTGSFEQLAEPLRRGLRLHCYRMLGSLHEAEDAVQDAYLRAWRGFDQYDGRGSFRAWLYRIATNACLDAIASRKQRRRFLPDQYSPTTTEMPDGVPAEIPWLEPLPDSAIEGIADEAPGPEARFAALEAVQLAFVAAIQELPPRQRAALLLCDVLGWSGTEAAGLLDSSKASLNSALQRARQTLAKRRQPPETFRAQPEDKDLLGRYMKAWENNDAAGLAALLREDAVYSMPPMPQWYRGHEAIFRFFDWAWSAYDGFRLVPIRANGNPAFAAYSRAEPNDRWTAHSLQIPRLGLAGIAELTLFVKPDSPRLFESFALPLVLT